MREEATLRYAGVPVCFPYVPYRAQNALMHAVVTVATQKGHALIESATGTGKSLALLCSALAWQEHTAERMQERREHLANSQNETAECVKEEELEKEEKQRQSDLKESASEPATEKQVRPPTSHADNNDSDFEDPRAFRDVSWQKGVKSRRKREPEEEEQPENAHLVHRLVSLQRDAPLDIVRDDDDDDEQEFSDAESDDDGIPRRLPRIFYATRTHNQVAQVIEELRKTVYRPTMAVLASRREYCIRKDVQPLSNRNEVCKGLVKKRECDYFQNAPDLAAEPELDGEAWDIEELNQLGVKHHGCPYYASGELYKNAQIIFCPYSYLLDRTVRCSRGINVAGDIVILDEAHNIESSARESASFSVDVADIRCTSEDIEALILAGRLGTPGGDLAISASRLQTLFDCILSLVDDIVASNNFVQHRDYENALFEEALLAETLNNAGIDETLISECRRAIELILSAPDEDFERSGHESSFPANGQTGDDATPRSAYGYGWSEQDLQDNTLKSESANAQKRPRKKARSLRILGRAYDGAPVGEQNTGQDNADALSSVASCVAVANSLVTTLEYYVENPDDFAMVVDRRCVQFATVVSFHLWCLNAAVAFKALSEHARSVIVTSGTLSPLNSFAGELGTSFAVSKSLPHVINVRKQLYVGVAGQGPDAVPFDATFAGSSKFSFQEALGDAIFDYCREIPGGVLVFLPSYRMLETLRTRWASLGTLSRLEEIKDGVLFEPNRRGEEFEHTMSHYAAAASSGRGAVLFAVCRGKLAEGIDFRDEAARGVIVVGIPFPHTGDLQILRKRAWNDRHRREQGRKELLPGGLWYEIQAYRALNQAIGRSVRHRFDYGAIVLVDARYRRAGVLNHLPGWTRSALSSQTCDATHKNVVDGLRSFFSQVQQGVAEVAGITPAQSSSGATQMPSSDG